MKLQYLAAAAAIAVAGASASLAQTTTGSPSQPPTHPTQQTQPSGGTTGSPTTPPTHPSERGSPATSSTPSTGTSGQSTTSGSMAEAQQACKNLTGEKVQKECMAKVERDYRDKPSSSSSDGTGKMDPSGSSSSDGARTGSSSGPGQSR